MLDAALGGSCISWTLVQPEVARFTRVCSYDRAGFGWSEAGPMPRTAGRIAGELRTLLERAGIPPPFVLVGHSFGGLVVQIFAQRYRTETAGLVLVDPPDPAEWATPSAERQAQMARGTRLCRHGATAARLGIARLVAAFAAGGQLGAARRLARLVSRGGLSPSDESLLAPMWKLPPDARAPLKQFWTEPKFFEALGSQIGSMCASAQEAASAEKEGYGHVPLITISATDPNARRTAWQDALARRSARGRHVIATRSGHWIPLDEPGVVVAAIRDVVQQVGG